MIAALPPDLLRAVARCSTPEAARSLSLTCRDAHAAVAPLVREAAARWLEEGVARVAEIVETVLAMDPDAPFANARLLAAAFESHIAWVDVSKPRVPRACGEVGLARDLAGCRIVSFDVRRGRDGTRALVWFLARRSKRLLLHELSWFRPRGGGAARWSSAGLGGRLSAAVEEHARRRGGIGG